MGKPSILLTHLPSLLAVTNQSMTLIVSNCIKGWFCHFKPWPLAMDDNHQSHWVLYKFFSIQEL